MGRLGAWWENAGELINQVLANDELELCGLLTHFADPADQNSPSYSEKDFRKFITNYLKQSAKNLWCMRTILLLF